MGRSSTFSIIGAVYRGLMSVHFVLKKASQKKEKGYDARQYFLKFLLQRSMTETGLIFLEKIFVWKLVCLK